MMSSWSTYQSWIPLLAILVSLAAVPLIILSSRRPNLREFWTIGAGVGKFALVFSLLPPLFQHRLAVLNLGEIVTGVPFALKADAVGVFFALIASFLWILTSFYSIGYVRGLSEHKQTRYFAYFAVCLSSTIGIAFSANLATFIIFYEILTIATYPLVIHKETEEAIRAGRKYLAYTLTAGVFLIAAATWTYLLTGSLDFIPGGLLQNTPLGSQTAVTLFVLFMFGVGVKAAIMPLHSWLPTAMAAPTPVSALLHAVAVVKSGVFGVIRVSEFTFGPQLLKDYHLDSILLVGASATIILASFLALKEDNLKRRLAYSTVAHLSYIVLGVGLVSSAALLGGMLHLAFHATMKITLFFCAGAIYVHLHKEKVSELDGIGQAMPWTMGAFAVGSLGLVGLPPVNGWLSKWCLGWGSVTAERPLFLIVLILSGLLNAAYFFPIVYRAFFRPAKEKYSGEASPLMVVPLVITAGLSIFFGIFPDVGFKLFQLAKEAAILLFGGLR